MICGFCEEPILPRERADGNLHRECHLRLVVGSVAHQQRRCGCFVAGSEESDPRHMTKRQAARMALSLFNAVQARN